MEGQTEEKFIKEVLSPYIKSSLNNTSLNIQPIIIKTKREKSGKTFKGGVTTYSKIKDEIHRIKDEQCIITTMFDYYGLPIDFPGLKELPNMEIYKKIAYLYKTWQADIARPNFIPYLFLHEFETLLFVDPKISAETFLDLHAEKKLNTIIKQYTNIEKINSGATTHPSARIRSIYPNYNKVQDGTIISQKIGIDTIRTKCNNFENWIKRILDSLH
ncbi:MAG: DUF4276 family protein [Leptospirales bacterium]